MKWRNLHNSVGSDDLKKPESGPRRGRPRIREKSLTLSGFHTHSELPLGSDHSKTEALRFFVCLITQRPRITKARTLVLRTCALAFEIWPPPRGVCRRIQDSEPIEIGEALGA